MFAIEHRTNCLFFLLLQYSLSTLLLHRKNEIAIVIIKLISTANCQAGSQSKNI